MSNYKNDRRRELRYPSCKKVECAIRESSNEVLPGLFSNISKSGICLHVYKTLDKGETITIRSDLNNSCHKATLQWVSEMDSGLYMAGFGCF